MKKLLATLLVINSIYSYAQEATKPSGKIDFGGSADFTLESYIDKGVYTYKLIDNTNEGTSLFSFKLTVNSFENFSKNVIEKLDSIDKIDLDTKAEAIAKLNSYYLSFLIAANAVEEDDQGPEAMTLRFSKELSLKSYPKNLNGIIKKADVIRYYNTHFDKNISLKTNYSEIFEILSIDTMLGDSAKNAKDLGVKKSSKYFKLYNLLVKTAYEKEKKIVSDSLETLSRGPMVAIDEIQRQLDLLVKESEEITDSIQKLLISISLDTSSIIKNVRVIDEKIKSIGIKEQEIASFTYPETIAQLYNNIIVEYNSVIDNINWRIQRIQPTQSIKTLNANYFQYLKEGDIRSASETEIDKITKYVDVLNNQYVELYQIYLHTEYSLDALVSKYFLLNEKKLTLERIEKNIKIEKNEQGKLKTELSIVLSKHISDKIGNEFYIKFIPNKIQLEINRGYIENITVTGNQSFDFEDEYKPYIIDSIQKLLYPKFINEYPIGISAKLDIQRAGNVTLYNRTNKDYQFEFPLGDLITNFEEVLQLDRKDYSPKSGAYIVNLETESSKVFHKDLTKEILQAKIYTDFVGLNETKPNGLIQFEFDKEIPLVTKRFQKQDMPGIIKWPISKYANVGFLNFLTPEFIYSKIEENERYLKLSKIPQNTSGAADSLFVASTLDLKQYEKLSTGFDLNLLFYDVPYAKSTFLLNSGIRYGRTDLTSNDSVPEATLFPRNYTNTYQPKLEVAWRINGDERFGLDFSYSWVWLFSDELFFTQKGSTIDLKNLDSYESEGSEKRIQRLTFLAYLNLNKDRRGRLFFRYRSNSQFRNWKNNFSQLQLGYTTFLTR